MYVKIMVSCNNKCFFFETGPTNHTNVEQGYSRKYAPNKLILFSFHPNMSPIYLGRVYDVNPTIKLDEDCFVM